MSQSQPRPPQPGQSSSAAGFIVLLVIGIVFSLIGAGLLSSGIWSGVIAARQNDQGYFITGPDTIASSTYALTSPRSTGFTDRDTSTVLPFDIATARLSVQSTGDEDIFVGVGPSGQVARYLDNVAHTEVEVGNGRFRVDSHDVAGEREPGRPSAEDFWIESATGSGVQEIVWPVQTGNWAVVVMNADASRDVSVDIEAGIRSDLLAPIALGLILAGLGMLVIGIPLTVVGAMGLGRRLPSDGYPPIAAPVTPAPAEERRPYPAQLTGVLDPGLSRWLWLVKWLLAIPHFIILAGLWMAFAITTVIAFFAILFTGRYPRSLFNFNVGVLRWNWRVSFYSYSALATDRYPPFTLARTDYPADFSVEYPERLSHGLVLVKWWLLAIPHYLIVSALVGGAGWWTGWWGWRWGWERWDGPNPASGISLLTVLVLIAAVILLFTNRFRIALFDFIMGINRWLYRVTTYAALLRDEYPPFRLDTGPVEPEPVAIEPTSAPPPVIG